MSNAHMQPAATHAAIAVATFEPPDSAPGSQKSSAGSRSGSAPSTASKEHDGLTPQTLEKVPSGVCSVFLTDATLDIANINKTGAKDGSLYRLPRRLILGDIQARAAISDFYSVKELIASYPEEEILLRYNLRDKYGDAMNFEICVTVKAKESFEQVQADLMAAEEERKKPKKWKSLGSEKEIAVEAIHVGREPIVVKATRKWRDFYSPHKFIDRDALESWSSSQMEVRPSKDISFDKFLAEQDIGIQAVTSRITVATQTMQERHRNNCAQYVPRNLEEKQKAAILCSEDILKFLKGANGMQVAQLEPYIDALQQNEIMDVFEDDFSDFSEEDGHLDHKSISVVTEYQAFFELTYCKGKMISAIDWMPGRIGIVAAACSESKTFDERLHAAGKPGDSYVLVWSFNDPIHPQMVLDGASDIFSLRFNPSKPELIAGGCFNGQVMLWDISEALEKMKKKEKKDQKKKGTDKDVDDTEREKKGKEYKAPLVLFTLLSHAAMSHNTIVSDIHWLPNEFQFSAKSRIPIPKMGETSMLASISADGKIIFWDITKKSETYMQPGMSDEERANASEEKYRWSPFYAMEMYCRDPCRPVGPLKMTFPHLRKIDAQFFVSTENGEVLQADVNVPEGDGCIKGVFECHNGPVRSLHHSPFFDNILLSVDIWTFAIWRGDLMKPIFISRSADGYLTTGCWSPTRPGVIYIGLIDGTMEVWDLLDHSHQPSMVVSVGSCQLTSIEFWRDSSPQLIAVGDIQGILHIMEIPRNLRRLQHKERQSVKSFLDRQKAWRDDVEMRAKERVNQTDKRRSQEVATKTRDEQLSNCTWDEAMEIEYHRFEYECRKSFGMSLDHFTH